MEHCVGYNLKDFKAYKKYYVRIRTYKKSSKKIEKRKMFGVLFDNLFMANV